MRGLGELLLVLLVLFAAWTRTPVGTLGAAALALARGEAPPPLLERFSTRVPERVERSIARLRAEVELPPATPDERLVLAARVHLGEEAATALRAAPGAGEATLERWALGEAARARAVRRASQAGEDEPERYAAHRRFLSPEERRRADPAVQETLALAAVLELSWPLPGPARISSGFGERIHPLTGLRQAHEGLDLAVPEGTAVLAAGAGRVTRAGEDRINGRFLVIDHGQGLRSSYSHGRDLHVARGARVAAGQEIMASGSTGRSTGPHLHFGLRLRGQAIDPLLVLRPPDR